VDLTPPLLCGRPGQVGRDPEEEEGGTDGAAEGAQGGAEETQGGAISPRRQGHRRCPQQAVRDVRAPSLLFAFACASVYLRELILTEAKLNLSGLFSEKLRPFLAEVAKKQRAALREAYSNREPPILRLNSQEDPCCTAASPPGVIMLPG